MVPLVDIVIRNGKLFLPKGIADGELSIDGGSIHKIALSGLPRGDREINARGKLIIPGVIDAHVHLYDKNFLSRGDFKSGSQAAAAGGVTTVVVMPLDSPVISKSSIKDVIDHGCKNSIIDFALHAGNMTVETIKQVQDISSLGIKSYKVFTCDPYLMPYHNIRELMNSVKSVNGVTFVHAEDNDILREKGERVLKDKRKDLLAHTDSRPNQAEKKAVERIIELANASECRVHLAHITTKEGCKLVKMAKKNGTLVSAETCPHFLIFTRKDIERLGPYLKINPPLKTNMDRATLWKSLAAGIIDIVATDHAPGLREEKEAGWTDIWRAPSGVPGVETLLTLMLSEGVGKRRISMNRMVNTLCTKAAKLFGLYPRKGVIQEGSDADLVMLDLKKEGIISAEKLHYKVGWSPYEGMRVRGMPTMTIVRGSTVVEDGKIFVEAGHGKFLKR